MKSFTLFLALIGTSLTSSSLIATELSVYQLKLKAIDQTNNNRVYRLIVENSDGQVVANSPKILEFLRKIGEKLNTSSISSDNSALQLLIEAQPNLAFKLQFDWKVTKGQGFMSCFQEWYKNMDEEKRRNLMADLHDIENENNSQLENSGKELAKYISNNFTNCASKNPNITIEGVDGGFLFTGIDRWIKTLSLNDGYSKFRILLNNSRNPLDEVYRVDNLPQADSNSLLKIWVEKMAEIVTDEKTFSLVSSFSENGPDTTPVRFALRIFSYYFTDDELLNLVSNSTNLTDDTQARVKFTDYFMNSCFEKVSNTLRYSCSKVDLEQEKFIRIQYKSPLISNTFSFLAQKN